MKRFAVLTLFLGVLALPLFAQNYPTGTLTGHITDGQVPLPGVTVTISSPSLQGSRSAVATVNGDYLLAFLPPGEYKVRFELAGFQTLETTIKISAAQSSKLDATMPAAKVAEEVVVAGSYETISATNQSSTTYEASLINKLPVPRDMLNAVNMAPGVHNTGPNNGIVISGAQSYENLFLINGVVVNENVRGQATNLFIEDAIQETTTSTSGVSAEFGRFAGGVVNMLTKSGGNEFRGTFRTSFDSDKWAAPTPLTPVHSRSDVVNKTYEATVGGFLMKDHVWFFAAGRDRKITGTDQTKFTNIVFPTGQTETRYEGKLTLALTSEHRVVGSYIQRSRTWTNYANFPYPELDTATNYDRQIPEDLTAVNYTGVLSDNFFVEGQASQRKLTFQNSGGRARDLIGGTPIYINGQGVYGNTGWWCGTCKEETRDNKDVLAKGSWFLSTQSMGSHDVVFGADQFSDLINSLNFQAGSDYVFSASNFVYSGANWYPVVYGDGSADIDYYPILYVGKGTDFKQLGVFVNDKWRLNGNWSFNLGLRYDKNDGKNSLGATVAKDSTISPRLGVTFDPRGDGNWIFNASFGRYVTIIAGTGNVADQSPQTPAEFYWGYYGPDLNAECDAATGVNCLTAHQVLAQVFQWFDSIGGNQSQPDYGFSIPGYNRIIRGSLKSPYAQEYSVGVATRLSTKGLLRADFVHRDFKNAYATRVDMSTGQVNVTALGKDWGQQDLGLIENNNFLFRKYDGITLNADYRLHDRLVLGGNYTWSHTWGNYVGETSGSGPIATTNTPDYYPEYQNVKWSAPEGDLPIDQRHKARVYAIWDLVSTRHHQLSVSLMENYFSGTPYGAVGAIRSYRYVTNPGYVNFPTSVTYYYTNRDAYRSDNITRTDASVTYSFKFPALGSQFEVFVIPAVTNLFNEHGVTNPNRTVKDRTGGYSQFAYWDPFTATPKECPQGTAAAACTAMGANWQKGNNFGKPLIPSDYQSPRTITLSVGFKF